MKRNILAFPRRVVVSGLAVRVSVLAVALFCGSAARAAVGRTVPVAGQKLVFSSVTGLLYTTVDSAAVRYPGSVTAIDPVSATVVWSIPMGGSPWALELSDDQRYLWVGVSGPKAVRVDLVAARIDRQFSTAFPGVQPDAFITDIAVFPGQPDSIVVGHWQFYVGGEPTGLAVFDGGVARPEKSREGFGVTQFAFGATADTVWGYNGQSTGFETYRFEIDSNGIRVVPDPIRGLFSEFFLDPIFYGGRLYSREGRAVDPQLRRPVGRFYQPYVGRAGGVALDAARRRIYFANTSGPDTFLVEEFDLETYRPTRRLEVNHFDLQVPHFIQSMADCGPAGLALGGFDSDSPSITIIPQSALLPVARYQKPSPQPVSAGIRRIPLPHNSIVYNPWDGLIYASLSNKEYDVGNSVVPVNPTTGTVGEAVWVGSEPGPMAVGAEGRFLFVALQDNHSVVRLRLPELRADLTLPLASEPEDLWPYSLPTRASELQALPGRPESVVVAKATFPGSAYPNASGVAVFDGAVERPDRFLFFPDSDRGRVLSLQPSPDPSSFYGYGSLSFGKLTVDARGMRPEGHRNDVAQSLFTDIVRCQDRYCFTPYGALIDGERQERIGEFAFDLSDPVFYWPVAVLPDLERGLVYFAHSRFDDSFVSAYDVRTLRMTARLKLPGVREPNGALFFWGRDQIALGAHGEIVLFPLSALHSAPKLERIPDMVGQRLYFPFIRAVHGAFTGLAVSNPGGGRANLQWTLLDSRGDARSYPNSPVAMSLERDQQTARLATEVFGVPSGVPMEAFWVELKTDSPTLGSFFQYGTENGLDGAVASTDPAEKFYFTRMFQGPQGLRGRPATTSFAIANPNGFAVTVLLTAYTKGRRSVDPPQTRRGFYRLAAKGFVYDNLFGSQGQEYASSYVKVEVLDADAGVVAFALVEADGGETLIGLSPESDIEGDRLYSAQMAFGQGLFTNLKLINTGTETRTLNLRAVADNGAELAPPVALNLRPGEALERDVVDIFNFSGLSSAAGSLRVESDGPGVIGDVLFGDPARLEYAASLPLQKKPFRRAVFSQVANRYDFFTGLAFFNPSLEPARIRIEVFAEDGTRTGERTLALGPGHRLSRLLDELVPSTAGQERGFVVVESDTPVIGQQLFGDFHLSRLSAVPPRVLR